MSRGMGSIYKTNKCNCDNKNWNIVNKKNIKSGKQSGKIIYIIYCNNCKKQWETSAKYAQELDNIKKAKIRYECPCCGCEDGNHAQECEIYYNDGYGKKVN